jgi:hypothetical protein
MEQKYCNKVVPKLQGIKSELSIYILYVKKRGPFNVKVIEHQHLSLVPKLHSYITTKFILQSSLPCLGLKPYGSLSSYVANLNLKCSTSSLKHLNIASRIFERMIENLLLKIFSIS